MRGDFSERWHGASGSNPQPAMHKQERRQGARNKEDVIEPGVKKNNVAMRLYQPTISGIQPAAEEK
jgi:hypothetical protein